MRSFLQQFGGCLELMRRLPPPEAAQAPQGSGAAELPAAAARSGSGGVAVGGEVAPADPAAAYRQSVEATAGTFLVLMTNMRWREGQGSDEEGCSC
jgi:hypothetical protein